MSVLTLTTLLALVPFKADFLALEALTVAKVSIDEFFKVATNQEWYNHNTGGRSDAMYNALSDDSCHRNDQTYILVPFSYVLEPVVIEFFFTKD